eukprot:COSAG02_NODE_6498_length_3537_cov_2.666085_2_plen_204_part_00
MAIGVHRIGMARTAQCSAILPSTAAVVERVTKSPAAAAAPGTTAALSAAAAQSRCTDQTVQCTATRTQPAAGAVCARRGLGAAGAPRASTARTAGGTAMPLSLVEGMADAMHTASVFASRDSKALQTAPSARLGFMVTLVTSSAGLRRRAQDVAAVPATGGAHVRRNFRASIVPSALRIGSAESARRCALITRLDASQLHHMA